jgi:SAM-dependent methyltransferase
MAMADPEFDTGRIARTEETRRAWDRTAAKYAPDLDRDIEALRAGTLSFEPGERGPLQRTLRTGCRALHLQCSHGQDALSLWRLGAGEVIGLDLSAEMIALAREKAARLEAPVRFIEADVLAPPDSLTGWADFVYTGKGALPWVSDIERWARVVARVLAPDGQLFLFEGHPINWVWEAKAAAFVLRPNHHYFDTEPWQDDDFPALAAEAHTPAGERVPIAWEHHWTLGAIVSAVADAGLVMDHLEELPDHFWPEFPSIAPELLARLPHTFLLSARKPTT